MDEPLEHRPVTTPFRRMLQVQMLHAAGDALVAVALADTLFFSVPLGEARDRAALYLLLTMTPFAVVAPVVGPLLDRWRGAYRIGVAVAAAGRAILAILMASRTDRLVLYPMAFGALVLSRAHGVSRTALVPELLPARRTLLWANSRLAIVSLIAAAAAAVPGAGVQKLLGPGWTLWLAATAFGTGAVVAFRLPGARSVPQRRPEFQREAHRRLDAHLLAAGAATTALRAVVGFLTFFLAFALRRDGQGARGFVAVAAAAAAGALSGSLLGGVLRSFARRWFLTASLAATAAALFLVAPNFGLASAAAAAAVVGAGAQFGRLAFDSMIQRDAPEAVRARAFARYETIFQIGWVGGAALGTVFPFGGSNGLRVAGLIALAGIVFAARAAGSPREPSG